MKTGIRSVLAGLLAAVLTAGALPVAAEPAADAPLLDGGVLCTFGDSLTALSDWPKALADRLNMRLINSGIGGHTSDDGRARFERDVLNKSPDFVIIGFGTNDFVRETPKSRVSLEKFQDNLTFFIEQIRAAGAEPVLLTCPYVRENVYLPDTHYQADGGVLAVLDTYNEKIRQTAAQAEALLIDIRKECEKYSQTAFLHSDGVHLSTMGNTIYANVIEQGMKSMYRQDPDAPRVPQPAKPTIPYGVVSQDIISFDPDDWLLPDEGSIRLGKNEDGSLSLSNTNGQWPEAHYSPETGVAVPVKGTRLEYDFSLEGVGASFGLFLNGSTPTVSREGESLSLNAYFDGAKREPTVGDLSANQTLTGSILLSDLPIPAACIQDGNVIISGLKVFAVGAAGKPMVIRKFCVVTDGSAMPPSTEASSVTAEASPKGDQFLTPLLLGVSALIVAAGVLVVAIRRKKHFRK
ncbi:MAG: hypothetical protein HFJ80_05100 [Clostridiales bacterium]|nr:hypothetical protein [Clostridiales bacterium]